MPETARPPPPRSRDSAPLARSDWTAAKRGRGDPGSRRVRSRPGVPAAAPRGRRGGSKPGGGGGCWGVGVARAHDGRRQTGGCWEGWAVRKTGGRVPGGRGRGPGARARLSRSCGRRREPRRRRRGRVASGATSAARGRRRLSPLAPQLEGAAFGARNRPRPCQLRRPPRPSPVLCAPSARPRRRPATLAVSESGCEGGGRRPGFLPSALSPSSVGSPAPRRPPPRAWLPRAALLGGTERERGRGGKMLGAGGGSLAGFLLSTCP